MNNFFNPNNMFPGMNMNNEEIVDNYDDKMNKKKECNCGNIDYNKPNCPTTYKCCPPIVTCSKQVINQYHITKQPYVHNYHTEVVHHHITENEFIPNYTCSEVHVNEPDNSNYPR